ncbi:MAG: heparinase II/III family protein [Planctomycetota bacterium]|nr:heparinase II/III family protein [Planctomycetota bacterium]
MSLFKTLYLSILTLCHFRLRQILYLLKDRFFRQFGARLRYGSAKISKLLPLPVRFFCDDLPPFVFTNSDGSVSIEIFGVNFIWSEGERWYFDAKDGLRPETLYYLEFLYKLLKSGKEKLALKIGLDFLRQHKKAAHPHYSAYTSARRLIVLLLLHQSADDEDKRTLESAIYAHANHIFKNLEYHLSANHLFKCAKGLLFAGLFVHHPESYLWRYRAVQTLKNEVNRQILPDGCHYERTFTYHCAVMEDLLDIESALATTRSFPELHALVKMKLLEMAGFLARCLHPDGTMPLFGDTAYGLAPTPQFLLSIVNERFKTDIKTPDEDTLDFSHSGYYGVRFKNGTFLIVNAGRMGAPDQPGHAHCDLFSFEFSLCGKRLIVDTGVYDYTAGRTRDYVRSTAAHNVAQIDSFEQSHFWASHRFASLAHPRAAKTTANKKEWHFSAALLLQGKGNTWLRQLSVTPVNFWLSDEIRPKTRFLSRLHFHPESTVKEGSTLSIMHKNIKIENSSVEGILKQTSFYEQFFGKPKQRLSIEFPSNGEPIWIRIGKD